MKQHNIVIADNQFLVTETLANIIRDVEGLTLTDLVHNVSALRHTLKQHAGIDLIITDYNLFDYDGFEELAQIAGTYPLIRFLILTNHVKVNEINALNKIGIRNIMLKTAGFDEIRFAIDYALMGKKYYSDEILDLLVENTTERDEVMAPTTLTPAETEITRLIANGLTTKEIAAIKHVSFHTIMSHRKNIFKKLKIKNTSELIMYAIKSGLIDNIEYYI